MIAVLNENTMFICVFIKLQCKPINKSIINAPLLFLAASYMHFFFFLNIK